MSEINHLSPVSCNAVDTMEIKDPSRSAFSVNIEGANTEHCIAELQIKKTAQVMIESDSSHDPADVAHFQGSRLTARLAGQEFFAHDGQVFSIYSRYSDVVNDNPAAGFGVDDITTYDLRPEQPDWQSEFTIDDGIELPELNKAQENSASSLTPEIQQDVADFQARRLAARLNGQEHFVHNGEQLSIQDHYYDYRVSTGDVAAKPEMSEIIGPGSSSIGVEVSTEELRPLPSEESTQPRAV